MSRGPIRNERRAIKDLAGHQFRVGRSCFSYRLDIRRGIHLGHETEEGSATVVEPGTDLTRA